jgi:hypothetical protein
MLSIVAAASIGTAFAGDVTLSITAVPILGGAYVLAFGLQAIFSTFSPHVPAAQLVHGFVSFPSITLTAATAAYGTVCYNLAMHTRSWRLQTLSAVAAVYVILLIGLGALYSGQLLSGIIGGFALGGCWLTICVAGSLVYDHLRAQTVTQK